MGHLTYGNATTPIEIGDELLMHLRMVILTKLRRNESFPLTVRNDAGAAETLWIHASIPLRLAIEEKTEVDRPRLLAMMNAASSAEGIDLTRQEFASMSARPRSLRAMSA